MRIHFKVSTFVAVLTRMSFSLVFPARIISNFFGDIQVAARTTKAISTLDSSGSPVLDVKSENLENGIFTGTTGSKTPSIVDS